MGAITIRKLDDEVVARLKLRAKAAGRSMEEEARQILTEAAVPRRLSGQMAVEHFKRLRAQMNGGDPFDLSPTLNAGFYNFVYLALALEAGAPLVTADERLIRAVRASPG